MGAGPLFTNQSSLLRERETVESVTASASISSAGTEPVRDGSCAPSAGGLDLEANRFPPWLRGGGVTFFIYSGKFLKRQRGGVVGAFPAPI